MMFLFISAQKDLDNWVKLDKKSDQNASVPKTTAIWPTYNSQTQPMILSRQQSLNYDRIPAVERTLSAEVSTYTKEKAPDIFFDKLRLSTPPRTKMRSNINQTRNYVPRPLIQQQSSSNLNFKSLSPATPLASR